MRSAGPVTITYLEMRNASKTAVGEIAGKYHL
jgi:hypothetical protein